MTIQSAHAAHNAEDVVQQWDGVDEQRTRTDEEPKTTQMACQGSGGEADVDGHMPRSSNSNVSAFHPRLAPACSGSSDDAVPLNFVKAAGGDKAKAAKRWAITRKWRRENRVDTTLQRQHPNFHLLRRVYPVYLAGRSVAGHVVVVEQPGAIDMKLMRSAGLGPQDMVHHLAFFHEYIWTKLLPGDGGQVLTVMDATGLTLTKMASPDVLALIRATSEVLNTHYPGRIAKILVINAPRIFAPFFKLLSTVMPASVRDRIQVCSSLSDLEQHIRLDVIPSEYGGSAPHPLGRSDDELNLEKYVDDLNSSN